MLDFSRKSKAAISPSKLNLCEYFPGHQIYVNDAQTGVGIQHGKPTGQRKLHTLCTAKLQNPLQPQPERNLQNASNIDRRKNWSNKSHIPLSSMRVNYLFHLWQHNCTPWSNNVPQFTWGNPWILPNIYVRAGANPPNATLLKGLNPKNSALPSIRSPFLWTSF